MLDLRTRANLAENVGEPEADGSQHRQAEMMNIFEIRILAKKLVDQKLVDAASRMCIAISGREYLTSIDFRRPTTQSLTSRTAGQTGSQLVE